MEPMFEVPGSDITCVIIEEDTARGYHPVRYQHKDSKETDNNNVVQQDVVDHSDSNVTNQSQIKTSVL